MKDIIIVESVRTSTAPGALTEINFPMTHEHDFDEPYIDRELYVAKVYRIKSGNSYIKIAWSPEVEKAIGVTLITIDRLNNENYELDTKYRDLLNRLHVVVTASFFQRLKYLFTGRLVS